MTRVAVQRGTRRLALPDITLEPGDIIATEDPGYEGIRGVLAASGAVVQPITVDEDGLDALDRRYLTALVRTYAGGPVGADTLAAALSEARDAVEDMIEPFLMQKGYVARTPRGRVAAPLAYERLGLAAPEAGPQPGLFSDD